MRGEPNDELNLIRKGIVDNENIRINGSHTTKVSYNYLVLPRVHNIYREGECLTTQYKRTASSNTSKLSYTLGFNLRVIMDDTTVNR